MTRMAVIIPFKGRNHKTRMAGVLTEAKRRTLALLMLESVVSVVREAGLGESCFVVSSDAAVPKEIGDGASFLREEADSGVNSAVVASLGALKGYDRFMILPSDLANLAPAGLKEAVGLSEVLSVVISPSASFTGTNLLLFRRDAAPAFSYDDDSFWHHLANAASLGLSVGVYTGGGVTFDLDTPQDAKALMDSDGCQASLFLRKELGP